jgi:cob(I)alamin adenosyltransferase
MASFNRITTRTGDDGSSRLPGGERRRKDDPLFELLGDLDELMAVTGLARSTASSGAVPGGAAAAELARGLESAQGWVGEAAATVSGSRAAGGVRSGSIPADTVAAIEQAQTRLLAELSVPDHFVTPGTTRLSAELHHARTVCRRAERRCVAAARGYPDAELEKLIPVVNRLSDYLFALALSAEPERGNTSSV